MKTSFKPSNAVTPPRPIWIAVWLDTTGDSSSATFTKEPSDDDLSNSTGDGETFVGVIKVTL